MSDLTDIFGPVIHSYTRAQGIADGVLHDVTTAARGAGFTTPVALTAAVYADCVAWTPKDEARKGGTGQGESGRLWDVLWMAGLAARRARDTDRTEFELVRVPREGRGLKPRKVVLTLHIGPGDAGEPVITIMQPGED